jgi:hypothetical protein
MSDKKNLFSRIIATENKTFTPPKNLFDGELIGNDGLCIQCGNNCPTCLKRIETLEAKLAAIEPLPDKWRNPLIHKHPGFQVAKECADELDAKLK